MTANVATLLEDLTKVVKHANLVPMTSQSYENLEPADTLNLEKEAFTLDDIKGWQKMTCHNCMIIWAEPSDPVRMSVLCGKCGGMAHNDGVF